MKPFFVALIVFLNSAPPALAQSFKIDAHLIDRCLAINDHTPMACVGRQADACVQRNNDGPNMVVAACMEAELAFWDGFLNRTYAELLTFAEHEQSMDVGYVTNELTDAARDMQRAWIAYRDATCGLYLARAAPFNSAAGPAVNDCLLRETARQVFQLQYVVGAYR